MSRALVINGAGAKGAFAVGVIKQLLRQYPALRFDILVGTSSGALIAPLVAMNEMAILEKFFITQPTSNAVWHNRPVNCLEESAILDVNPLWQSILAIYTDNKYAQLKATKKQIFLSTTCLQTGELVVFTTAANPVLSHQYKIKKLVNGRHFRKALFAASCQPVLMPPIKVNNGLAGEAHPHCQFVDGGLSELAGIQMAIDNGATEIFTILLSPEAPAIYPKEYENVFSVLQRTIAIFSDNNRKNDLIIPQQYNVALDYIEAVKDKMKASGMSTNQVNDFFRIRGKRNPFEDKLPLKLFVFRPEAPLDGGGAGLSFAPKEMKALLRKGEAVAADFISALGAAAIT